MVEIGTQTDPVGKLSSKDFPKNSLGNVFPDFISFRVELEKKLGDVIFKIVKNVEVNDKGIIETDWVRTKKGLTYHSSEFGLGILWEFVARNFYLKYRSREFVGERREFVDEFIAELAFIVAEIRRKEWVWTQLFKDVSKWTKLEKTETEKTSASDKSGKTTSGGGSKYTPLTKETADRTDQHGSVTGFDQKGGTIITKVGGTNFMPLGKILGALNQLQINFSEFYPRFERLWNHYSSPTLEFVIDPYTGRRKWVTEEELEEIMEPEKAKEKKKLGPDAFAVLDEYQSTRNWKKYLEALAIYHDQNEKEHDKLPESSNRKPRIANRVKIGEGLKKAYSKFNPFPSIQTFKERIAGKTEIIPEKEEIVEGKKVKIPAQKIVYPKLIGHENIVKIVENYLFGWEYAKKFDDEPPRQLKLALLGPPGLGKSFIAGIIAKALGRKYMPISLNGKQSADVVYGTDMSNPGSDPGEITKAISRSQDQTCLLLLDEIEKSGRDAKFAIGNPTDPEQNWMFKDRFYDFPSPCHNVIFFAALNYPEDLPDFVGDRFTKLNVKIYNYRQRIEIARDLISTAFKKMHKVFAQVYRKSSEQIFSLFNREDFLKKTLTWTFSVRGMGKNIYDCFIPTLKAEFLMFDKNLPIDVVNYNWNFVSREDTEEIDKGDKDRRREPCPYSQDKKMPHRKVSDKVKEGYVAQKCVCFVNNLDKVPGWVENMGTS
ncbi:MAG: AAA family ATPase [Candidatus Moeniiplasma glomeromycotorum]|nr:AAA family ATPase [Candidatus Moeniiplasma glomeromycotorum]MCE8167893.1 AAA family ATPase [Candidatus Moeniiplasma glomeromycotorum]MCE8169443.1 AAA family ATPase [Candidatus Moeniiplasma glomeromycotorum]